MKKKKRAQVKKNNTSNKNRTANTPENLLKPFKSSYRKAKWLTYGTSFIIFCNWAAILLGVLSFSLDQLKSLVSFTFNIIFVFAAFVFTIFTLHSNIKSHPQKDKILLDYVGQCTFLISISIFVYVVSCLVPEDTSLTISILFNIMLTVLWLNMSKLLFLIYAFFGSPKNDL